MRKCERECESDGARVREKVLKNESGGNDLFIVLEDSRANVAVEVRLHREPE